MSIFTIGYYTLLLAVSCLAAYFNKRQVFLLAFSLTLVSFILGIVGGVHANLRRENGAWFLKPFNMHAAGSFY